LTNEILDTEIYELDGIKLKNPIIFTGFVGAGLVGPIAIQQIIDKLNMKEIGFLRSKHLPPATVFTQGRLRHPFRFYSNDSGDICAIICEIVINSEGLYTIASAILDWAEKNGSNEIIILDGIASDKHDKKAFCAAEADLCRVMEGHGIQMIPQGFIIGISGGILNECLIRKIKGVALLVKADETIPDTLAAVTLIESINKVYEINVDADDLKKQKVKIGNELKELSNRYSEHKKIDSNMYM